MARYWIGIDPGVHTGIAVWDGKERRFLEVRTLPIVRALELCEEYRHSLPFDMVFEDARRRTWIPQEKSISEYRGKLMGAGSVKRDCDIWEEYCTEHSIPFTAIPPRKGLTKWDAETFSRITGWKGRTSNHARDAALLVFQK